MSVTQDWCKPSINLSIAHNFLSKLHAEDDFGQAGHATPHDGVAWWRVAERILSFCAASWPPPNPAPDDFDLEFASTVYFRLGGIAISHSFLRTPEVINFLLPMKSKQDHSDATVASSAMVDTQAGLDRCNGRDR